MKKFLACIMSLALLFTLVVPASAASTDTAATLRLEQTEGTVKVSNASGKSVKVTEGMRLYSGYTVSTNLSSYAYISLDSTKAVKLDASSKVEVRKSGKKLELTVISGKLFFNVTAPVEEDESLNIRTSTMVTGVRGTSGWVEVTNRFTSRVHLLEGTLTVTSTEPATGQMRQATITSGQTATATLRGISQPGSQMTLTVNALQEKQVPGFVAVEVAADPALQNKIAKKSPLSVPEIIRDAQERLKEEQQAANKAEQALQEQLGSQKPQSPDPVFTQPPTYIPPTQDPEPSPEPSDPPIEDSTSVTLDNPTAAALLTALTTPGVTNVTVTNASSDKLSTGSYTVASGQTLTIQYGSFAVGEKQTLTVEGTFTSEIDFFNAGTVTVNVTGTMNLGGTATNNGNLINKGTFTNSGYLTNYGNIETGSKFICPGSYVEARQGLYAMVRDLNNTVSYLGLVTNMPDWQANTSVTLLGAEKDTSESLPTFTVPSITVPGVTLDLNGKAVTLESTLTVGAGGELTITGSGRLDAKSDAITVSGGKLTMDGGTVTSTGGIAVKIDSGSMEMSNGTVEGAVYGIQNSNGTVTISDGTVTLTADPKMNDDGSSQLDGYAVSGPFTFYGGALKAKNANNLIDPKYPLEKVSTPELDGEGYYTVTSTLKPEM